MSELRGALLIIGVVFLTVLTWWERRRPRQPSATRRDVAEPSLSSLPPAPRAEPAARPVTEPVTRPEPKASARHEPTISEFMLPEALIAEERSLPTLAPAPELPAEGGLSAPPPPDPSLITVSTAEEPIVEWPPDGERRVVTLRLVAASPERFSGRAVRQALAAEGFVAGRFSIFHKPAGDRRAYLSAANLTKPGSFDLEAMDSQRFGGLSLFAVLPGPKPPEQAFEELLGTARGLNERLRGALQDERGGPLTPTRIAVLRESVVAEAPS